MVTVAEHCQITPGAPVALKKDANIYFEFSQVQANHHQLINTKFQNIPQYLKRMVSLHTEPGAGLWVKIKNVIMAAQLLWSDKEQKSTNLSLEYFLKMRMVHPSSTTSPRMIKTVNHVDKEAAKGKQPNYYI